MQRSRLLLPFIHGIDTLALDYAVQLAASRGAVLVALSLIAAPGAKLARGARLEAIQQSQDFLVAVRQKAACLGVPLEVCEVYSADPVASIKVALQQQDCDGTLFFLRDGEGVLLETSAIKRLTVEVAATHSVVHLPSSARSAHTLKRRLALLLRRRGERPVVTKTALT